MNVWYKQIEKELEMEYKIFIDFDPTHKIFYYNFYFNEFKFVLKIAISPSLIDKVYHCDDNLEERISESAIVLKIEKFDLTKYVYLLHFE